LGPLASLTRVDACNPLLQAHPTWARDEHEGRGISTSLTPVSGHLASPLRARPRARPIWAGARDTLTRRLRDPPVSRRRHQRSRQKVSWHRSRQRQSLGAYRLVVPSNAARTVRGYGPDGPRPGHRSGAFPASHRTVRSLGWMVCDGAGSSSSSLESRSRPLVGRF
jgi:hypothetical protein